MGKMNLGRVILGGLVAGVIIDACEFVINAVILKQAWADAMTKVGKPVDISTNTVILFNIVGLVGGIAAVWFYAAIRSRFGAGVKTAVIAALAMWVVGYAMPAVGQIALDLVPMQTMLTAIGLGVIEVIIATVAGAAVYKEDAAEAPMAMSAGAR